MIAPAAMDFLDTSYLGRGGEQEYSLPSMKDLLRQVYSAHVSITQGLQKQVSQLSEIVSKKDHQLRDASCHRCTSVKDAFERYKASHQQIIEKQEVKISLLENRIMQYEKEQRERNASFATNVTPERGARTFHDSPGRQRQQPSSCAVSSSKASDFILQEDSLGEEASYLVPPSPVGGEKSVRCKEIPETVECGGSTNSRVKEPPPLAALRTVPETLECNLYGDGTDDELPPYQPPLTVIAEEDGIRGSVQPSQDLVFSEMAESEKSHFGDEKTIAESRGLEHDGAVVTDEHIDDEAIDLVSQESPSLLQRDILAHPVPCESRVGGKAPPANAALSATPQRSANVEPHRQLFPAVDDKSPSLLDFFAVPKCVPVPKGDVEPLCFRKPAVNEMTVCDEESGTKVQPQPSTGKLSLLRKRSMPAGELASKSTAQPQSTAKCKKQSRLSDRYFLSVNRTTVPATRSSRSRTKKELSQTHVDTHFTDDLPFSLPRRRIDPDETFVAPELLQDAKMQVSDSPSFPESASPAATTEGQAPAKAVDTHADEASSISAEPSVRYHNSPVLKKAARQQLPAHECKECQEFYDRLELPEAQRKDLLRKCSRHRALYAPPPTPDHFWELDFPDTQECRERGYLNATQKYVFGAKGLRKDGGEK
ncbi:uncharacterized protein LOC144127986 isoform X2 [Amblyomma americanum]